ncbi:MAG: CoA transferase [Planctomycetota bacterium]|nr:CoA transferase [Planctomycetota bacterium]
MDEFDSIPETEAPPLVGIRVLDLTRILSGPFCTMVLADLGAEVVKIERPGSGDDARAIGPFLSTGESSYFASLNRGKQSVALDLQTDPDHARFLRLVKQADVVVENFRPAVMADLGLGADRLRSINPRLIYAGISGFGRTGARASQAAYDVIIQALSGLMSITGVSNLSARVGVSISDLSAGLFTAIGILAALQERERTGIGATLDLAMLDCSVAFMENALTRLSVTGDIPRPLGTQHPSITPFQAFETADGSLVVAAATATMWRNLCNLLGDAALANDPRFADNESRTRHRAELVEVLTAQFARQPTEFWLQKLMGAGVPVAPVRDTSDVLNDPELAARGMLHSMNDGNDAFVTAGSPIRFQGRAASLSTRAPTLGEHGAQVFRSWLGE